MTQLLVGDRGGTKTMTVLLLIKQPLNAIVTSPTVITDAQSSRQNKNDPSVECLPPESTARVPTPKEDTAKMTYAAGFVTHIAEISDRGRENHDEPSCLS
ncbi:unnamed protein product [Ectocarpus sp. CCAP 1310/34]|nr:unnamed protein product [Ectocarpus sp. CCAP 1310/34]